MSLFSRYFLIHSQSQQGLQCSLLPDEREAFLQLKVVDYLEKMLSQCLNVVPHSMEFHKQMWVESVGAELQNHDFHQKKSCEFHLGRG